MTPRKEKKVIFTFDGRSLATPEEIYKEAERASWNLAEARLDAENQKTYMQKDIDALHARIAELEAENTRLCPIADRPVVDSLLAELAHANNQIAELAAKLKKARNTDWLDEALNSDDGVYRP